MTSSTKQMTIFYGGQAHVFDDVHPNKVILLSLCLNTFIFKLYMNANVSLQADVIMALAGSSGGSWSTDLSHKLKTKNNTSDGPYKLGQMFEGGGSSRETPFLSPEIRGRPVHQDTSSACHRMFTQPGDFLFKKKKKLELLLQVHGAQNVICFAGRELQGSIISRRRDTPRDQVHISDPEKKPSEYER